MTAYEDLTPEAKKAFRDAINSMGTVVQSAPWQGPLDELRDTAEEWSQVNSAAIALLQVEAAYAKDVDVLADRLVALERRARRTEIVDWLQTTAILLLGIGATLYR